MQPFPICHSAPCVLFSGGQRFVTGVTLFKGRGVKGTILCQPLELQTLEQHLSRSFREMTSLLSQTCWGRNPWGPRRLQCVTCGPAPSMSSSQGQAIALALWLRASGKGRSGDAEKVPSGVGCWWWPAAPGLSIEAVQASCVQLTGEEDTSAWLRTSACGLHTS